MHCSGKASHAQILLSRLEPLYNIQVSISPLLHSSCYDYASLYKQTANELTMSDQAGSGKKRRDSDSSSSLFRQFSSIRRFDPGYSSSHQASSSSVPAEEQEISSNSKTKQGSKDKKTFIKRSCPHCKKTLSKSSALEKHIEVSWNAKYAIYFYRS